jgi:CheY-like chemotaxis protein
MMSRHYAPRNWQNYLFLGDGAGTVSVEEICDRRQHLAFDGVAVVRLFTNWSASQIAWASPYGFQEGSTTFVELTAFLMRMMITGGFWFPLHLRRKCSRPMKGWWVHVVRSGAGGRWLRTVSVVHLFDAGKRPELQIVGQASDGLEAAQKAHELQPDLILLDIGLPTLNGIDAARRIRKVAPKSKILFVSQESSSDVVEEALALGALGYVVKTHAGSELLAAVEAVRRGRQFVSAGLLGHVPA